MNQITVMQFSPEFVQMAQDVYRKLAEDAGAPKAVVADIANPSSFPVVVLLGNQGAAENCSAVDP